MRKRILIILLFAFTAILISTGCGEKDEPQITADDLKKKELELKEKELQLKEKEMIDKKETELKDREKQLEQKSNNIKIELAGTYAGTIKDGTYWHVVISNFDGKNFKGYNKIYWKSTPEGFKTNYTGTYDNSSGEIIMHEDRNAKGSGKFIGSISKDGNKMSGTWYRYTDNGSFTWELERNFEEFQ